MSDREEFEEKFPVPLGVKWCERQQDYTYENYRALDSAASYSGKWQAWQAARAQSGQGAEPIGYTTKRHVEQLRSGRESCQGVFLKQDDYHTEPLYTHPHPAQRGSVPEEWHYVVEVFLENAGS